MNQYQDVATRIHQLMRENRIESAEQLHRELNHSTTINQVNRWLNGSLLPRDVLLEKLSEVLFTTPDYITFG